MQQPDITSRDNARIKYACKLAQSAAFRQSEQSFLAEGSKLCLELAKTCPLKVLYTTARALEHTPALAGLDGERYTIADHVAEKLAGVPSSHGVFGVFGFPPPPAGFPAPGGRYLALENVQDPGNVGALVRSAAAFGYDAVILGGACADPFSPKTLRASMGACGRLPLVRVPCLPDMLHELKAAGIACLAAALYNSRPLDEVDPAQPGGVCLVIGSEGQGLTDAAIAACDAAVRIPISPLVESLNAGVAGSVLLWHFRKGGA